MKRLKMFTYNKLRQTNSKLAKTKHGQKPVDERSDFDTDIYFNEARL